MKVAAEVFKGIEFVRISNLPGDQKEFVISIPKDRIIKILKDGVIIKDCIQYHDYISLYNQYQGIANPGIKKEQGIERESPSPKFAFK